MYSLTTFQQLMKGLPRGTFDKAVKRHGADKYLKGFKSWNHLIAMIYGQLSGVTELRPLTVGFNSHVAHHYHLGASAIKRSTLADANERRSDAVFKDVAVSLMQTLSRALRQECEELMYLLDSTSITLKGREFDSWTLSNKTRHTQGIKFHVLMNANGDIPVWTEFSAANVNDIERAWDIKIEKGALYVFDKGYNDYNWWCQINQAGATFVTRFKRNASVNVIETLDIEAEAAGVVLADEIVSFKHKRPSGKRINRYYGEKLRRITIARPGKHPIVLATNDFKSTALEIAQRYKERWGIELFFKWIKQHLRIKKFMGRSENAVRIQILTALISYLLVAIYNKERSHEKLSLWERLCLIRATLFQRSDAPDDSPHRQRRQAEDIYAKKQGHLFA